MTNKPSDNESLKNEHAEGLPSEWSELWNSPDDEAPGPEEVQDKLRTRKHYQRWKTRLELVAVLLGVIFTIGLLLQSTPSISIVVLCVFCWLVWGTSLWAKWQLSRTERRALTSAPAKFVQTLRKFTENRTRMIQKGRYMLVAAGVFCAVWVSWFVSENWVAYQQEPWRAVVGIGGVIVFYLLAIYLQRREQKRLQADLEGLEQLERRLAANERE
jgi:hypothetical protein